MALSRAYRPYTRLEHYDLDGLMNVLERKCEELAQDGDTNAYYYVGAFFALSLLRYHEFIDTQEDFMRLLDRLVNEEEGGDE